MFIKAALTNTLPLINGDVTITRDFTSVSNVTQTNTNGLMLPLPESEHFVFNVAFGKIADLTTLWNMIKDITKSTSEANYGPNGNGDIMFSLADIEYAKRILGNIPDCDLTAQLRRTIKEYKLAN